jgi:hypothetical protein
MPVFRKGGGTLSIGACCVDNGSTLVACLRPAVRGDTTLTVTAPCAISEPDLEKPQVIRCGQSHHRRHLRG